MAGMGPAPKPANRRARTNSDPIPQTILTFKKAEQPNLPALQPNGDPWPDATVVWWRMWVDSAQADLMTATDWSFLLDTAVLHARLWSGEVSQAAELRLRVAKFGATPEDRARLRIQFADADQADGGKGAATGSGAATERFAELRFLRGGKKDDGDAVEAG